MDNKVIEVVFTISALLCFVFFGYRIIDVMNNFFKGLQAKFIDNLKRNDGTFELIGNKLWLSFQNEWVPLKKYGCHNWIIFTPIIVQYEDETCCRHREIALGLLGFILRISWHTQSEKKDAFFKKLDDAKPTIDFGFYGWASARDIKEFKDKKKDWPMVIYKTRKIAKEYDCKNPKKLFLQ